MFHDADPGWSEYVDKRPGRLAAIRQSLVCGEPGIAHAAWRDGIGDKIDHAGGSLAQTWTIGLAALVLYAFVAPLTEEEANGEEFSKALASLADVYVDDAFGSAHRAHASTEGITHFLPSVAGLLMEREVDALSRLLERPPKPFHALIGGAKVTGKLEVLEALLSRCQAILVGGGMANTFLAAKGHALGKSLVETEQIDEAQRIMTEARRKRVRFMIPTDVVIAPQIHYRAETQTVGVDDVPKDMMAVDIGPQTVAAYTEHLAKARTVFWNGPMGVFEIKQFAEGTNAIARFLADRTARGVITVVGGGDSVAAVEQLGVAEQMTHVSTGGGASLEFLEGKTLPGVAALDDCEAQA